MTILRGEEGVFLEWFEPRQNGFDVYLHSANTGSYTVRVEDVWERLSPASRCFSYKVAVQGQTLEGVAPDARIFFDAAAGETVHLEFTDD